MMEFVHAMQISFFIFPINIMRGTLLHLKNTPAVSRQTIKAAQASQI